MRCCVMQVSGEQRLDQRLGTRVPLQILCEDSRSYRGTTVNISSRGLSCVVPTYVQPYSRLSLYLDVPRPQNVTEALEMDALVVRSQSCSQTIPADAYELGLFFLHLDQSKAALINDYLNDLENSGAPVESVPGSRPLYSPSPVCQQSHFNPQDFLQDHQLTRLDRLTCLGELSAVLSHEIKNPLACLAGSLETLRQDIRDLYPSEDLFSALFEQVDRIDRVVDHLLQFSLVDTPRRAQVQIDAVIDSSLRLLEGAILEKKLIIHRCHGDAQPPVPADERLLRQAFVNLFATLIDSLEPGCHVAVNTRWKEKVPVCQRQSCSCFSEQADQGVSVAIIPSEPPLTAEQSQQSVALSQRKQRSLNLSVSQQIIEQHQGRVFTSRQPQGRALLVTLPL